MKSLSQVQPNDYLIDSTGSKCMVMARTGDLIARSAYYRYDVFSEWRSISELEVRGFKVLSDGKEVMKKREVEELLHIKII